MEGGTSEGGPDSRCRELAVWSLRRPWSGAGQLSMLSRNWGPSGSARSLSHPQPPPGSLPPPFGPSGRKGSAQGSSCQEGVGWANGLSRTVRAAVPVRVGVLPRGLGRSREREATRIKRWHPPPAAPACKGGAYSQMGASSQEEGGAQRGQAGHHTLTHPPACRGRKPILVLISTHVESCSHIVSA